MTAGWPPSPIEFPSEQPDPGQPQSISEAISRLSRFRVQRLFRVPVTKTAAYTISPEEDTTVLVDATSAPVTITLPLAQYADAIEYVVKKIDSSANAVTVSRAGSDTIDGGTTFTLTNQWDAVRVVSNGSLWYIVGGYP